MSHLRPIRRLILSLLTLHLSILALQTTAATLAPLNTITNPTPPPLNTTLTSNPPPITIPIDATHRITFSQYRHLSPERNYFAAIISMQTSLIAEYFERKVATLDEGGVALEAYGAQIEVENPTGALTYEMAHRTLGELGEFLMEQDSCAARFELWRVQRSEFRQISEGFIMPEPRAGTAA